MSFNVSAWSIRRRVPTVVLFMVLTLVGLISFGQLGIDATPNIDVPVVTVTVNQLGASPAELESEVTKEIEDTVAGLGNIERIVSTINDGVSTTSIFFELGTDSDRATNDVRNAIAQIRQNLPQDINDPVIQRQNFSSGSIMTYAVVSDQRSVEALSDLVDRTIARKLLAVPGVAQINRVGGVDREVQVNLDPAKLDTLGITATEVNDQIRQFNVNLPGGRANVLGQEQGIRTLGSAPSVDNFKSYRIILPNGASVPLSTLGTIEDGYAEARQSARLNRQPVVTFSVQRSTGSTLATVETSVRAAVEQLPTTLPDDIRLELIFTRADSIRESYQASIDALVLGCVLAVLVVGVFLRDWRATLITALALPLSIIPTFIILGLLNYTLNSMSLLAFAIAVGNLVDDAIVEIENVNRHIKMGKTPYLAALDSTAEVGLAVITTTATIVAVFIPVAFMGGVPGQFFKPFGVTVAVSTMFSTLVARLLTPMLAAYWMKGEPQSSAYGAQPRHNGSQNCQNGARAINHGHNSQNGQQHGQSAQDDQPRRRGLYPYRWLLGLALRHRLTTLALALVFFVGSLMLIPQIPKDLFSNGDTGLSFVSVELPPGSTLRQTEQASQQLTDLLLPDPAVGSILSTVGEGNGVNQAKLTIKLKPKDERVASQREFEQRVRPYFRQVPGARISFDSQGAGGSRKDLLIVLKSENPELLTQTASAVIREMQQIPGLVEVTSSASLVRPEIVIQPDPDRAADQGVSVSAIARTASLATLGDSDANLAQFNLPDRQIPIRVQLASQFRNDIGVLQNLRVPGENGRLVPLISVADIKFGSGPAKIDRYSRSRQVSLEANFQGITLGEGITAVAALPTMRNLPPGVTQEPSGDAKIFRDVFTRFGTALGTAVLMIYAVLVLLYNNFLYPLSIMAALPLSIGGALLGLMVAQKPLGLFALIGIVLLMGLVTKNSILLVDYALLAKAEGKSLRQSVTEAGITRLRPIVMTSISTVAGMLPIALELGAGGSTRSPMAIAVIGGFTTSTLLTLVVVPVLFTYIDGFQTQVTKLVRRLSGRSEQPQHLKADQARSPSASLHSKL
ncbi:MAG: efflux RND transporter permease subunit [Cyanothece sp. SIO1E1]|nr:efflux RND transporter permease subunit [Cyanothece sp. SIO1E1]